jgi:hypothetical protein
MDVKKGQMSSAPANQPVFFFAPVPLATPGFLLFPVVFFCGEVFPAGFRSGLPPGFWGTFFFFGFSFLASASSFGANNS